MGALFYKGIIFIVFVMFGENNLSHNLWSTVQDTMEQINNLLFIFKTLDVSSIILSEILHNLNSQPWT